MSPSEIAEHLEACDFGSNVVVESIVKYSQAEYLVDGENGLCIMIAGCVASAIINEMNRGGCNIYYIQSWLENVANENNYRQMITYCRENQGRGEGVTSFRCQERPVTKGLNGYGKVLGVYFDLKDDAHACCILPSMCGTVALFFDPNFGIIKIRAKVGVITVDMLDGFLNELYSLDVDGDIRLRVGVFGKRSDYHFGKRLY